MAHDSCKVGSQQRPSWNRQAVMGHLKPRLSLMFSLTPPATSATASLALQIQHRVRVSGKIG